MEPGDTSIVSKVILLLALALNSEMKRRRYSQLILKKAYLLFLMKAILLKKGEHKHSIICADF